MSSATKSGSPQRPSRSGNRSHRTSRSRRGPAIEEVKWTSPRPFGVGTTREVVAPGGSAVRERYFRWDEGRSHAFFVYESALPIFRRFAEDYVVEPDRAETLFTWTVAIEPKNAFRLPLTVLAPALNAGFGQIPSGGQKYFAKRR
jgi:hypothetical protein